jgi:hypothetical protein
VQANDQVVYVSDPILFGTGTIERVLGNGRLVVMFEDGSQEEFSPPELELLTVWLKRDKAAA